MPRKSSKATTTTAAPFFVKVKPSDAKITLRLDEPQNQTGQFTQLSAAKSAKLRTLSATFEDSNGVAKYGYIVGNIDSTVGEGYRDFQRVSRNAEVHRPMLEVILGKKAAAEMISGLPKAGTKSARKSRNGRSTKAAASGSESTEAMIRRIVGEMVNA